MLSISFRQARAAATGAVLALTAGLAGLLSSPVHAQSASRTNVATVATPAGVNDTVPANNTGSATVTINTAAAYSFCPAPHGTAATNDIYSIVNNGIARYAPGAGADANVPELAFPAGVTGDLNALMVDRTTDRLLFHRNNQVWAYDADNGGWYVAASGAPLNQNFPRGGFNASGIGYLVLGGGAPAVVRLDPSGPFDYTATSLGNLTFDVTPTGSTGSGDIAFDGAGNAWMLVGRDLYLVNFTTMQAVRQTRPLLNGAVPTIDFAGIAFAEDGSLYLGFNGSAAYYQYDFATGELTQTGTASAAGSRDLASCAFPVPPEADLGAVKSLAQVNGAPYVAGSPVSAGDTLTYAITLSNTGTAVGTLYPGDVIESVPANTTYVAAGNTFTQAAGADWTIASAVNVPAGGSAVLNFVVRVNDPLPAGVTSVANNVTFPPGDLIDCADAGNDCSETTPIGPSIVTTKTSNPASGSNVSPGQTITYTLNVVVSNAATTAPLTLTDTIGTGLTFGAVTSAGAFTCNAANPLVCTLPANTPVGTYPVTYTATVDAGATPGTTVANSVATDPTNNGGDQTPSCPTTAPCTTEHNVVASPNLEVAKTGPATAVVGVAYDYQIVVTNNGGTATTADATVTDTVPTGLTINTAAGCTIAGQVVTCTVPTGLSNVAPNNTASFTINVTPQASTANTTVTNTASVSGGGDPDCVAAGDCPSPPVDTDIGAPNLDIAKTGPATAVVGVAYAYTITVTNTGASATADATVTDAVPAGLTINSVAPGFCAAVGQDVTCTIPQADLEAGDAPVVITINVTPQASVAGTTVVNTANIGGGGDPDCATVGSCPSPPVNTDVGAPDLSVAKTGPATAVVGVAYDYVVTVTNTGTAATTAPATVTDTVPTGLTINTAAGCTIAGQVVTCTVPAGLSNVAPNNTASFTINVTPQASTAGTTVTNIASVGGGGDPDCVAVGDCPSPPVNTDVGQPNLDIGKTGPATAVVGVAYDYVVTVTNTGSAATTAPATVTDTVPTGLTINTAVGCTIAGQTVTCPVPTGLAVGASASFTINVTPQASTAGSTVTNTASVSGGGDPDCAAVGDCESPPVDTDIGAPNLEVGKTGPATAIVGVAYDYVVTVTNTGTAATTAAATVTDVVPTGLTINTATGCTIAGQTVTCAVPAGLAVGASTSFTINVTPQVSTAGSTVTNTASVTGGGDPDCVAVGDCESPPVDTDIGAPNLEVGKTGPATATVGVAYDYVVTVTNTGTAATTAAATVTDVVPTGLTINTATGCTIVGQTVTCPVPTGLAVGASASFTINVTPQASTAGSTVTNTASVTGGGDPDCVAVGDCPSPPVDTDIGAPNLEVGKTGPANAVVGVAYDYVVTVTNTGSATTTAPATVTDVVPTGLTINTAVGCTIAGQTVTCAVPTGLAVGASTSFTINVTPQASTAGSTVTNTASVTGGGDPDCVAAGDCPSPPVDTTIGAPNLSVAKTGPATAVVGVAYDYQIVVTNTGAATTAAATVTDTIPAGLTINTATGCTIAGQVVTCTVPMGLSGTAPNNTASFTINVTPQASTAGSTVTNVASVSGGGDPDCLAVGDCPSPPVDTTIGAPNLEVGKTGPANAVVGVAYDYVVTVTNTGTAATTVVATVTDTVPTGLTINTAAGCTIAGQTVTCAVPAGLAVGASSSFTINVTPQASTAGSTVTNTASVTGGGDPDCVAAGDCESPPVDTDIGAPNLEVGKTGPANAVVGVAYDYVVTVTNIGTAATTVVATVTDTVPTGLTINTAAGCTIAGQTVTCAVPAGLAVGASASFTINVTPQASTANTTVTNTASVTGGGDPDCVAVGDCPSPPVDTDIGAPNLEVGKTGPATAIVGVAYDYLVTVTNTGNAATTAAATVTDVVPTGLTINTATGCTIAGQTVTCAVPVGLAVGASTSFTINVTPQASTANTTVTNTASVTGGGDPDCVAAGDCESPPVDTDIGAPNLEVGKTGPATAIVGVAYDYVVTVTNTGSAATTAPATVTDVVPTGLTINTATGCTIAGQAVTCAVPVGLAVGASTSFTINVTPQASTANTTVTNTASVTGGGDPDCVAVGDCPSPPVDTDIGAPNLEVGKTGPANATVGVAYDYVVTVTNTGTAATTAPATVTDTVPTGLTINTAAGCTIAGQTVTCAVPVGLAVGASASFTINVTPQASTANTTVTNTASVTGGGDPDCAAVGDCESPPVDTDIGAPNLEVGKTGPANATVGVAYDYVVTVTNTGTAATTVVATVTDTVPTGLTINTATGCTIAGQTVTCAVPAGLAVGASASFTINVTPQASTAGATLTNVASVSGGGDPDCAAVGDCESPPVDTQVTRPVVTFNKSSNPASGADVEVGEVITYTLSVTVAAAPTLSDVVLTDTAGAGLGDITVTSLGVFTGGFAGSTGTFTLASGTAPGTYTVVYTATVQPDAGTTVGNRVEATGGNPPPGSGQPPAPQPTCDPTCTTEHNVVKPAVTVVKSADPLPGTDVAAGDVITYTLTVTVVDASLLSDVVLTDTLGAGLTFGAVTSPGAFACNAANPLVCTLPSGTAPGTYTVQYTATVDVSAATTVQNRVEATGGNDPLDPDNPQPTCTTCTTEHNVVAPVITVAKSSNPGSGAIVRAGDTIAYTLTVAVARSATLDTLTLTDTLGAGLSFGALTNAGAFACNAANPMVCTLPAGTPVGTYALTYTATVDPDATRVVSNVVTATGGTGTGGSPPTCGTCSTEHLLADPRVTLAKSATPGSGQEVSVGDTIEYTLTVTVENSATLAEVRLIDTPGPGLALGTLPAGCVVQGATAVCTLAAGTVPGVYTFTYPATVTADANGQVRNVVVGESGGGDPECTSCETFHEVVDEAQLRIVKAVAVRNVKIGDLVRYTLTVENVGAVNVTGATVVDTPPAGFSYVEGSMAVDDRNGQFTLTGQHPLRIGGLDIDAGGRATIVYLLRVGAGVRPGVHVNEAVAVNGSGNPISNIATAQVTLDSDPLLDDSLIFGTVFDDRDGDGWQDRADLGDVRVQGGFAPGAYVAGSTTIDRGDGPQPVADASAPLLHGIDVGAIAARQSEGDPVDAHRVTIRQRLTSADFTGDFVLTSAQGVTVRMDAAGNTTLERSGEAAKGLNAAEPTVQRSVSAVDGGFEVAYVIANAGIDERGIPGVRIASVEGLLIETDQYGRYHLADVHGGDWGHGRNFLLKVDPATLPAGTVFTTENPRVRRVTPGIPVRFDFGVKLPVQVLEGGERKVELELGEVIFAPASAEVRETYLPAIRKMAERVDEYRGGDVVIVADGSSQELAFARAAAVRDVLQGMVGAEAQGGLNVVLRTQVNDPHSLVAGVDAGGALLGTVLFDTDKSSIRPEFEDLLDAVARRLDALGGGVVAIVGHTDVRASHAYNAALGLRRATAVQQALAKRLSPEVRAKVRVEASSDPAAPVGTERK